MVRKTMFFCALIFLLPALAIGELVADGDVVKDSDTGLMWQKVAETGMDWEEALAYCEAISIEEYNDWRLPTRKELLSIIDYAKNGDAVTADAFGDTQAAKYWSSTNYSSSDPAIFSWYAWYLDTADGSLDSEKKWEATLSVRAVRGGQNEELADNIFITSPEMASTWMGGGLMPILWNIGKTKTASDVKISISRDGGGSFDVIAVETPNDGVYMWEVTGPLSDECVLKIEPQDTGDAGLETTQETFSIGEDSCDLFGITVEMKDIIRGLQILVGQ